MRRLAVLSVGVASFAVAILVFGPVSLWVTEEVALWAVLLAMFIAAESFQLHIEIRRQTFSVSLSELPLVIGFFALGPLGVVISRLAAAALVMSIRRVQPIKASFNLSLFALECAIFATIVSYLGYSEPYAVMTWVAVFIAVVAVDVIGSGLVLLVIGWTQSWPSRSQQIGMAAPVIIGGLLNASLGLVILIVLDRGPEGLVLLSVVSCALVILFRSYADSLQEHRTLGQIYDFAKQVEGSTVLTNGGPLAIEAVREMLNAQRAALWLLPADRQASQVAYADVEDTSEEQSYDGPADVDDPLRQRVLQVGAGVLFQARSVRGAELGALNRRGATEVIGVPLSSASGLVGYMEVCDRRGDRLMFTAEDVRVMESLATHVSSASQNVQLLSELRYEASHDRMTGLPNRARLTTLIEERLQAGSDVAGSLAALVIDLGTLKQVNETLGHDAGDELLIAVSELLAEHTPLEATVGRMGGDEFAVLLPVDGVEDAERQALRLREAISVPCSVAGVTVEVSATIGLALADAANAPNPASLLQRADVALYAGRNSGQAVTSYQPAMDESSLRRLHLGTQLREAMLDGQIFAVFQPLIDLGSSNVRAAETLLRWQHPRYGAVSPDDFIPLAERIGMIDALTMHVLQLALRQCRSWLDRDIRIEVAVNLSPRTLSDRVFPHSVAEMLEQERIPAELLTFEITESSVMEDPDTALPVLHALHSLGVKLAIDDFGTGYSSLAYLSRLPVDEVKIDKAFIANMGTEINDSSITKAIIDLAHGLGLSVVAEGVEDELTRDLLADMGCDTIQGYLVSRPLPGSRLDRWLAVRTAARPPEVGRRGRQVFITSRGPLLG